MEFYIVKTNIWFGGKLFELGEVIKLDPADTEVQKLVTAGLIESTGTLVDQSEPVPSVEEIVEDINQEIVQEQVQVQEEPKVIVEPEPELKQDPKIIKKGKNK